MTELATVQKYEPFSILATLEQEGAITRTSLVLPPDMPMEKWAEIGEYFGNVKDVTSWLIGDWLLYGEEAYGEKYSQAADATGLVQGTLANYAYVCRKVARSRRRKNLRFSHHKIVAPLEPSEQIKWLDLAEENGWSRDQLTEELKEARALPPPPQQPQWTPEEAQEPLPSSGEADPSGDDPTTPTGLSATPVTGEVLPLVPADDPTPEWREATRRLLEEAEPLDDDRYYRVPRELLRELAALADEE